MSEKVDLKRVLDGYRARRGELRQLELPPTRYLAVDGEGDPNTSPVFATALEALYPAAYRLKFASKAAGRDYVVPPLEGLWWSDDMTTYTTARDKSRWRWTLLSLVPDWVGDDLVAAALDRAPGVRLEHLAEGLCVQTLHVGSFDDEARVLARIHDHYVPEHGLRLTGRHHEIYLSDRRRTPPERQRTILRQPVTGVADRAAGPS